MLQRIIRTDTKIRPPAGRLQISTTPPLVRVSNWRAAKRRAAKSRAQNACRQRKRYGKLQVKVTVSVKTRRMLIDVLHWARPDEFNNITEIGDGISEGLAELAKNHGKFV
ncbi:MAG: hypothetical protein ACJ8EL_14765 [Rhizomicrobium sp.]